ncbi:1-deoxy-D-xylulose-5-phosphate synthase (plasmid) [Mesorhizobium loti]|nr:1-deoxy-D-xylulose-5-phosphate synthase [Mesorhizobium loti]
MAREPLLIVTDMGINGVGNWRGQRHDTAFAEKHDKTMNAVQVVTGARHCAPITTATATMLPKATDSLVADLIESNVADREPSRKMAGTIDVTTNG